MMNNASVSMQNYSLSGKTRGMRCKGGGGAGLGQGAETHSGKEES